MQNIFKLELSTEYADIVLKMINPKFRTLNLTTTQKDIVGLYNDLNDEKNTLLIQKTRQKGVTTICKVIAFIEANNGKKVLYFGYGPRFNEFKNISNIKYHDARENLDACSLIAHKYDLIIVDEMITFTLPIRVEHDLRTTLSENGKMIIVGTPLDYRHDNYKVMKEFFKPCNVSTCKLTNTITYTIHPDEKDRELAKKYPEMKNELLGEWKTEKNKNKRIKSSEEQSQK